MKKQNSQQTIAQKHPSFFASDRNQCLMTYQNGKKGRNASHGTYCSWLSSIGKWMCPSKHEQTWKFSIIISHCRPRKWSMLVKLPQKTYLTMLDNHIWNNSRSQHLKELFFVIVTKKGSKIINDNQPVSLLQFPGRRNLYSSVFWIRYPGRCTAE